MGDAAREVSGRNLLSLVKEFEFYTELQGSMEVTRDHP